jgi:hypothetical protein
MLATARNSRLATPRWQVSSPRHDCKFAATGEDNPDDFKRLANERLATPYPENGSEMREIREQKELSIKELSTLSGLPESVLERAESGNVEVTDEGSGEVQKVYWSLAALEASPADYRRLLAEMPMKANED